MLQIFAAIYANKTIQDLEDLKTCDSTIDDSQSDYSAIDDSQSNKAKILKLQAKVDRLKHQAQKKAISKKNLEKITERHNIQIKRQENFNLNDKNIIRKNFLKAIWIKHYHDIIQTPITTFDEVENHVICLKAMIYDDPTNKEYQAQLFKLQPLYENLKKKQTQAKKQQEAQHVVIDLMAEIEQPTTLKDILNNTMYLKSEILNNKLHMIKTYKLFNFPYLKNKNTKISELKKDLQESEQLLYNKIFNN